MFKRYLRTFSLALLATWLLAGCSSNDDQSGLSNELQRDVLSCFNADGKAWLILDINLSDQSGMRAVSFDDGTPQEQAVKTLTLVLFHGTGTEDEMQVASTYEVGYDAEIDEHAQLTSHSRRTIQISSNNLSSGDQLALLAIANVSPSVTVGQTFEEVKNTILTSIVNNIGGTDYYVMSNSPLATNNDGTGTVATLMPISTADIYPSASLSASNPAGQIYLERAAAKVTVTSGLANMYVLGNSYATFENSDLTFALDNYNTTSYACRHLSEVTYTRFVESAPLPSNHYRTYWGEDVNYSGSSGLSYVTHAAYVADNTLISWSALGGSDYCAENTFGVDYQRDDCTTSVLVRLQLNNGTDFYTTSVTGQDVIFQSPSSAITEEGTSGDEAFARRSVLVPYDGTSTATIDDYLRTWLMQNHSGFRSWVNTYAAGEPRHVQISVTGNATTGVAIASSVTQTARGEGTTGATAFAALHLEDYLASHISLKYYANGYCYYRVHIRHFTDEETPWSSVSSMTANTTAQVYGSDAEHYLGRYGMLRNHWYTVNIKSVTHVGSPIIPALTMNADDAIEQLLNATLTISGWESHSQDL
ncbi:MAG: Mfa1 fimbrilin C-terminal domain-containing protein [Prevotella sp.]|nr:Mfa1 fimbrilin C-terminal domain-containing protein [Prevotella sp.]